MRPNQNSFFSALPIALQDEWSQTLVERQLGQGASLFDAGQMADSVYLPVGAVIAGFLTTSGGETTGIGVAGREAAVGLPAILSGVTTSISATVIVSGPVFELHGAYVRLAMREHPSFLSLTMRYFQAFFTQSAYTAVCNRYHSPEQQLCTLLLRAIDRSGGTTVHLTQELASKLIGVRRETISLASTRMQLRGAITAHRGHIEVNDRAYLESAACTCYAAVRHAYRIVYETDSAAHGAT